MTHPLTPREKVELKPCPMCGMTDSDDNATQESGLSVQPFKSPAGGEACRVQCVCGASGPSAREDWQAASSWNRRTALASGSGDHAELARLKAAMSKSNDEICQSLGKALGYPWFKDDQRNFPGATEGNGVCVGDHVAESIADEAASRISALLAENAALRANEKAALKECSEWARKAGEAIGKLETSEAAGIVEGWQKRATEAERKLAEAVGLNERAADLMRQCTDPERFEGASTLNVYANMRAWLSDLSKEAERG